jgi:hypothetical protein
MKNVSTAANRLWALFLTLVSCLYVSGAAHAASEPLFVEAVDYKTIEDVADCEKKPYYKERVFSRCTDPDKLFDAAKTFALNNDVPLVILWGFDECPACESLKIRMFDPDMLPSDKAVETALSGAQKVEFAKATKDRNQLAIVRMNSGTSLAHYQAFADKIGANKVASDLGWKKVWSPMFMVVNPKTGAVASNGYFRGYQFCTLGEELVEGLADVGVITANPNATRNCGRPDASDEDAAEWGKACDAGHVEKCAWAGIANQHKTHELKADDPKASLKVRLRARKQLTTACDNNYITACRMAAGLLPKSGGKYTRAAVQLLRKSCDGKDLIACSRLGYAYEGGEGGLRRNIPRAVNLIAMACDAHDPFACGMLGEMAFYKDPGTDRFQSRAKTLLAFTCRNDRDWACDKLYK